MEDAKSYEYRLGIIRQRFPDESDYFHHELVSLHLEQIDRYGVAMSPLTLYKSVELINKFSKDFPEFRTSDGLLKPDYIKSVYVFITVLHNLHKITSKLIFTSNINKLYAVVLDSHKSEHPMGYSILNIQEPQMKMLTLNALQICQIIRKPATETNYLEIIIALQTEFTLTEQWLMFTKIAYNDFRNFQEIPKVFLNTILED